MDRLDIEPWRLREWIQTFESQVVEVQDLMQIAPQCEEFPDLLSTLQQAIKTAQAALDGPGNGWCGSSEDSFTVDNEPLTLDLPSCSPDKMAKHVTAVQQRAALLGTGPPAWAIGANCQARASADQEWNKAVIEGMSQAGKWLVEWLPSARETSFEVERTDLKLVPPIAGAFWTPKQPPAYDKTLPPHPVVYSEEEKAAQRTAYNEQVQAMRDAIDGGQRGYTWLPGVYRCRETMHFEDTRSFTLTMGNVELISEDKGHFSFRNNHDFVLKGPLVLDANPLRYCQCEIVGSDEATYLDLQVMPGCDNPNPDHGKVMFYDSTGKSLPVGQVWCESCKDNGAGKFRMEFAWGHKHALRTPGVPKVGNFITQGTGPENIGLSCDINLTFQDIRCYNGGDFGGLQSGVCYFTNVRSMRRPGTNRLRAGGRFYQIWFSHGSFVMDRCEVSNNDDDLSDVFTWMGYAADNAGSDSSIFAVTGSGIGWGPGDTLCLYDCHSLKRVGCAKIKTIEKSDDSAALDALSAALETIGKGGASAEDFHKVQLDRPLKLSSVCHVDNLDSKPQSMSFTNCYFHDGLNAGITPKGAHNILTANCVVERTAATGYESSCSEEGAFQGNVVIRNNTIRDSYWLWGDTGASGKPGFLDDRLGIEVSASACAADKNPSGRPIKSATVYGNLIVSPNGVSRPIKVSECASTTICGNLPADPLPSNAFDDVCSA